MIDRRPLPTAELVALSLPTLVFAGYDLARRSFLAIYLSGDLKLSVGAVGWLVMLASLTSIPAEVLAGALGDYGLQRLGRRSQWIVLGTIILAVSGVILLRADRSTSTLVVALTLIAFITGWALCNVAQGAWALEITSDPVARTRIFGWRSFAGIAGGIGFSAIGAIQLHQSGPSFLTIMIPAIAGAGLAHGFLVTRVQDSRPVPVPWKSDRLTAPLRLIFANRANSQLAVLFALNGAHTAITTTSYLYVVGFGLALPGWGPSGILVQSICAAIGVMATIRFGSRMPAADLLRIVLLANLLLAVVMIALPPRSPDQLMAWSAGFGLFSVVDFMALRIMLGERLDFHNREAADAVPAAAHYAGFHLPFNLCGAVAGGVLFLGYTALGFEPNMAQTPEQLFAPVILMPALSAILAMVLSLWILAIFRHELHKEAGECRRPGVDLCDPIN